MPHAALPSNATHLDFPRLALPRRRDNALSVPQKLSLCLALGVALSHAQTAPMANDDITRVPALNAPGAATSPTPNWPAAELNLAAEPSTDPKALLQRWRDANAAVAEFPRGHVDLLRWESKQLPKATPSVAAATPVTLEQAIQASLAIRPELFVPTAASRGERAAIQRAYADHVNAVTRAWVQALWARQALDLSQATLRANETALALAERMAQVGNWSAGQRMQQQAKLIAAREAVAAAQMQALTAQEELAVAMGWWQAPQLAQLDQGLPRSLPTVPALAAPSSSPEALGLSADAQLQSQALALATSLPAAASQWAQAGAQMRQRVLNQQTPIATDLSGLRAPEQGRPPVGADEHVDQAVDQAFALQAKAIALRSQARLAWAQLSLSANQDRLLGESLVPLAQAQEEDIQLHYNGMLMSTWDLIDAAIARISAQSRAASARYNHWLAYINWQTWAAGGTLNAASPMSTPASASDATASAAH